MRFRTDITMRDCARRGGASDDDARAGISRYAAALLSMIGRDWRLLFSKRPAARWHYACHAMAGAMNKSISFHGTPLSDIGQARIWPAFVH